MPNWKEHTEKWEYSGRPYKKTHLYSPNMGTIEEYEADLKREGCLYVKCNGVCYLITQNPIITRIKSFVSLTIAVRDSDKNAIEKELKEIASLTGFYFSPDEKRDSFIGIDCKTTDPRIVRAYILMRYEYFKEYGLPREKIESNINALLNKSLNLSIEDAIEWLRRNGFRYSEVIKDIYHAVGFEDKGLERYWNLVSMLEDPYWLPKKKG